LFSKRLEGIFMRFGTHVLLAFATAGVIAACGGGSTENQTGTLRLSLTDAPPCGYDHVWVTVERARVHRSNSADPSDSGWSEVALATPQRIDLLEYSNGRVLPLGETPLPAGTYTQMRLVLSDNAGTNPPANAVQLHGTDEAIALTTPSGQQSGLKMNVNLTVNPDTVADFVIDFDACKSVVKAGKSGKYLLKPVLSVYPMISSKIVGWVDSAIAANADVSAQSQGKVLRSTSPDPTTGRFELAWVPVGTYQLVITAPDHVNAVMPDVPVTEAGATIIGSETIRLSPPAAAASAAVSGTVAPSADADVRALQALTSDTKVEVQYARAAPDTGAYTMTLPRGELHAVPYDAAATTFTFSPIDGTEDKYTLEASVPGETPKTEDITLSADVEKNFVFP
jgi:hypothetical protein